MRVLKSPGLAALAAALVAVSGITQVGTATSASVPAAAEKTISFGQLAFDPRNAPPAQSDRYRTNADGKGLRFVQFAAPIHGDWLGDLRAFGIKPLQYYPHDTYLVWADENASRAIEAWPQVRWQGAYQPQWKQESGLGKRSGVIRNVGVHFYNDGDVAAVLAALTAHGAKVLNHGPAQADRQFFDAWIEVDAAQLDRLAELPQVVWLEYASPQPVFDDEMSSQILARNYNASNVPQLGYLAWLGALGYNGDGVIWAIIDSGVDLTHPDFAGRIAGGVTYPGCPAGSGPGDDNASGGHGTHVAGIVGGTGAAGFADVDGFKYGIGMAPGVRYFAQNPICVGGVPWPPAGGWQVLSKDALTGGAIGGNASWTSGEGTNAGYTAGARAWDQIIRDGNFDTPINDAFMMVFSAGNSGPNPNTLTAPKEAKNTIITGGTQNYRVSQNIDAIYNSSSRGPTVDGRYGITIATPGQQIASARRVAGASQCGTAIAGTNNHYAFCTGTSMAAPHASGSAVLLTDWWRDTQGGVTPSPAMIKALLMNGAKDVPGAPPIPNTTEGWGRVDIPGSMGLDYLGSEYLDQSAVLDSVGEIYSVTFGVPDGADPLKVSLAWTDAAAAVGANPTLVNNLDLEVETNGQTYRGNVFNNGMSATGGTADNRNNVENVFVAAPGGSVTIRVIATNLPGDGIPNTGAATDQDFALVCRNCVEEPGFTLSAAPTSLNVCAPANASTTLSVGSILAFNQPVTLAVTGQPAGSTASFTTNPVPTLPGSSVLNLTNTGAATAGNYTLAITGTAAPSGQVRNANVGLTLATAAPPAPTLTAPANNSVGNPYTPTLTWQAAAQAVNYRVQLASDAGFGTMLLDQVVTATSVVVAPALASNTTYYWRVTPNNICGTGTVSTVFNFKTAPAPGDCDVSATPVTVFSENFSGGLGAFTTTGSTGASTWAISTARPSPVSGGNGALAVDIATASDQRLISPAIVLPSGQLPLTLQFQNDQSFEDRTGGCYDGGIIEVSTNAGSTWTQITGAALLTDPYDGPIGTGNPLGSPPAWCGDPQTWMNSIVDVSAYAGQTVQFRWRVGTDGSVGRVPHGWYVDDIKVQSCAASDNIFANGFEMPSP